MSSNMKNLSVNRTYLGFFLKKVRGNRIQISEGADNMINKEKGEC